MKVGLTVRIVSLILPLLALPTAAVQGQVDVLTNRYGNDRTGANLNETTLTPATITGPGKKFGKLFERFVDGDLYSQPLIVTNVDIPGKGKHNVVYLATANNRVYAYDADGIPSEELWSTPPGFLGTPVPREDVGTDVGKDDHSYQNFERVIGITSTPVIDKGRNTIYVVAKSEDSTTHIFSYKLHALDLSTGNEKGSPKVIEATFPGTAADAVGGNIRFDAGVQLNRPGLLLFNDIVYIAFGSHNDYPQVAGASPQYHGWILAYRADTLERAAVFCTTPDAYTPDANTPNAPKAADPKLFPLGQGGIWQSGAGLAAKDGYIYAVVGNGWVGGKNHGECVLQLSAGDLGFAESFTPNDWVDKISYDRDLSTGAVLLPGTKPGTTWVVAGNKEGNCYLLNSSTMTPVQPEFTASKNMLGTKYPWGAPRLSNIHGTPVFWNDDNDNKTLHMYVWGEEDYLRAYKITDQEPSFIERSDRHAPPNSMPGGMLTISANGGKDGIVWATLPFDGGDRNGHYDAENDTVKGVLCAFDASDISTELWNSETNPADSLGMFAKFCPPVVANGKVYVATFASPLRDDQSSWGTNPPSKLGGAKAQLLAKPAELVVYGFLN